LMVLYLMCSGTSSKDLHAPYCIFTWLDRFEDSFWSVISTLLNVPLIILTLRVSRLLNLLLRLVAFLLFLNPLCLASISRCITASSSWKRVCLFVCKIGRAVQQECRDRSRIPSSACQKKEPQPQHAQ